MAPIGDAPLDRTGVNIPAQRYCQTHWWSTWEGCGNNLKKRCLRQNRPRHWVLKLDLALQLDQQTLLKPQLYDHSISPIFGEKVAFRTSREVLHRKAKWSLCIFKNQSQFRTTSEASIIFEFVVNFSLIWFGRGQELYTNKSSTSFSLACKIYPGWLNERQQGKTMQLQWSDLCQLKKGHIWQTNNIQPMAFFWCRWQNAGWWCREWQERAGSSTGCVMDSFWRHKASFIISTLCSSHLCNKDASINSDLVAEDISFWSDQWERTSSGDLFSFVEKAVFITRCLQKNC